MTKVEKAGKLYAQKGTYVSSNNISPNIRNAIIATEDHIFIMNMDFQLRVMHEQFY